MHFRREKNNRLWNFCNTHITSFSGRFSKFWIFQHNATFWNHFHCFFFANLGETQCATKLQDREKCFWFISTKSGPVSHNLNPCAKTIIMATVTDTLGLRIDSYGWDGKHTRWTSWGPCNAIKLIIGHEEFTTYQLLVKWAIKLCNTRTSNSFCT